MGLSHKYIIAGLLVMCLNSIAEAGWQDPVDVISGTWGANNDQFGIEYGDTDDDFAGPFYLLINGNIIIRDIVNGRRKIYTNSGFLIKVLKCQKTSANEWNEECRIYGEYLKTIADGNIWTLLNEEESPTYVLRSPTGQLIKTSTAKPLELGRVKSEKLSENNYKITVTYPDKTYGLSADRKFTRYVRVASNSLYGVNAGGAWRFDQCGKLMGTVLMPSAQRQETSRPEGGEDIINVNAEYGRPVVSPDGDVYTWKRTPDNYSILKWTWVDDPNDPLSGPDAPTGLTVMPSTTGIYLTWTASPQDPGCVTGYEIARAMSSGGVYSTVITVDKGVMKYSDTTATAGTTYYYKLRAVAGSEYSPYTNPASATRP